jgi:hypothetical protein
MHSEHIDSSRDETYFISAVMGFDLPEMFPLNAITSLLYHCFVADDVTKRYI